MQIQVRYLAFKYIFVTYLSLSYIPFTGIQESINFINYFNLYFLKNSQQNMHSQGDGMHNA